MEVGAGKGDDGLLVGGGEDIANAVFGVDVDV